jgi:predicted nuclease of predicted toxin-antitoxin system
MKIIIDMNLSPRWADVLCGAGFEADHWSAVGDPRAIDRVIFDHARAVSAIILTHDLDFGTMLAATSVDGPSVVQIRANDVSPDAIGALVVTALRQLQADLLEGALVTVEPAKTRMTLLPLKARG